MIPKWHHLTAWSSSASAKTIEGLLPPHSSVMFFRLFAASFIMARPVLVLPVKATLSISICPAIAFPVEGPRPGRTLTTPAGRPASLTKLPKYRADSGVCSAGLRMTVLPQARAGATFQASIMKGKFQGIICPQTPRGSCRTYASLAGEVSMVLPLILSAAPA